MRVGLVLHRHLEPELDAHVMSLIKQLGAEKFDERNQAKLMLLKLGGAAFPLLEMNVKSEDTETATQCREILNELDARPIFENKPATDK